MHKIKGSNILVTGGCGFIGSHLINKLLELGAKKITVIDSLKYGDKNRIDNLPNVKFIEYKIGDQSGESRVLSQALKKIDFVFHLAAEKHKTGMNNLSDILKSNIDGSFQLFAAAAKNSVKKIIFSSSVLIYNRTGRRPFKETDQTAPETIYGISKLTGERFLKYFYDKYGLKHIILRYFFVYGPKQFSGMGYKSVIVKNFERILQNENPVIFGDGRQALDYIYIDDAVNAAIAALESDYTNETFNVGSSVPTTINHLTDIMLKISGKKLKIIYGPGDETHNTSRAADISKIKKFLKFSLQTSLKKGLESTYNWLKSSGNF